MITRRFVLFLVAGGVAALANIGARIAFNTLLPYVPSIVLAYCVGMLTAFVLNRLFVFTKPSNALHQQVLWFLAVNAAAVLQTVVISVVLARWVFPAVDMAFHPATLAHVIGVLVPVVTSYLGHKHLTFRSSTP